MKTRSWLPGSIVRVFGVVLFYAVLFYAVLFGWDAPLAAQDEAGSAAPAGLAAVAEEGGEPACDTPECVRGRLSDLSGRVRSVLGRSALDAAREAQADALYAELDALVREVRDVSGSSREHILETRERITELRGEVLQRRRDPSGRTPGLDAELQALNERLPTLQKKHDDFLVLLSEAQAQRRLLRGAISAQASARDRAALLDDVVAELSLIEPGIRALVRHRLRQLRALPSHWNDWSLIWTIFSALLQAAFVGAVWWFARRRLPDAFPPTARLILRRRGVEAMPADLWGLDPVLRRAGMAIVDLLACVVLLPLLRTAIPEIGLVVLLYAQLAVYRLGMALTSLALAEHPQVRPALRTLPRTTRNLALRTVRLLLIWGILRGLTTYLALHLFAAVAVEDSLRLIFRVLAFFLAILLLHQWEAPLRRMLLRRYPENQFLDRLCGPTLVRLRVLRMPLLLAAALVLGGRDAVRNRGGWLGGLLQERGPQQAPGPVAPLPDEVVKALMMRECGAAESIEREEARAVLEEDLRRWDQEKRRGVITLIGEEGAGKHVFLDRRAEEWNAQGREPIRFRLSRRFTDAQEMIQHLATVLEIDDPPRDPSTFGARVGEVHAGKLILLEGLHFTFLRRVGGFDAVAAFLQVLGASHGRVYWVLALQRAAWLYLNSTGLLDTGLCEPVLHLGGFSKQELRRLVTLRTEAAGYRIDFSPLAPRRPPGEVSHTLERAEEEYFRRLAWISRGNPSVALRLWRESLRVAPWREKTLEVERFCYQRRLPELRDSDLFVLAAIHTHRSLSQSELTDVTNMSVGVVQTALSKLEGHRLVVPRAQRYSIEPLFLPPVLADLRRRHILYDDAA